jgi:phage terminase large subunit
MAITFPDKLQCLFEKSRYKVLYGGRGGAKSWGIARALLIQGAAEKHKILCAREIQKSINDSVHSLLVEQINALELDGFYTVTKTSIVGKNGTEFLFAGLRSNISNIKSIPGITRAWVEEAQTVSSASMKVLIPTVREDGSEIWLSFNPELEDDPIYQNFVIDPPTDSIVVKIGWQDNPWFPAVLRQEKDDLKRRSPLEYENVWEGKCKHAVEGAIFANEISKAAEEQRITKVLPQAGVPVQTFWDLGESDNTAIWFVQIVGMEYRLLEYYQASGQKMPHYIEELAKRKYLYGEHVLPHDADYDQQAAASSIKQQLLKAVQNNANLGTGVRVVPRIAKKTLGIDAARTIFQQCLFDKEKTADGLQCLRHYAYAKDPETNKTSKEPKHDDWSHGADAFLCFAQHFKRPVIKPKTQTYHAPQSFWAQ